MSVNYASGLSPYPGKGKCGLPELFDSQEEINKKVQKLAKFLKESKFTVFHTGAGLSTAAGIPDFRGPKGVWTLESKGLEPKLNVTFDEAQPTFTHRLIVLLEKLGLIHFVITQNVDGLHLRSGFPRDRLAILHGDMFLEQCDSCQSLFVRETAVNTLAQRPTGGLCTQLKSRTPCRGRLRDTILDWEAELPVADLKLAEENSRRAELSVCLGSSLQILPSSNFPTFVKRRSKSKKQPTNWPTEPGHLVIVNLQETRHDKLADVVVHSFIDNVMQLLADILVVGSVPAWIAPVFVLRSQHSESKNRLPWKIVTLPQQSANAKKRAAITSTTTSFQDEENCLKLERKQVSEEEQDQEQQQLTANSSSSFCKFIKLSPKNEEGAPRV